ncbi:MAG: hypothetical protein A2729_05660 [Candidatus Buchananbacteria bacterium RIFCSPHIGHO2_01_FULL_39_14]|uniref:GIY-YIG domain-containing protein n=2 Tax=Candidatus Buchananiibacteriota TaxID=1817903 RepID=A0A1G1YU53_9BACT|nr:MAG: hypothetical protein A2729_05660 [Candidatus Buchananbacteria bacterium RIFCSPHIGHO2_01_FULL_39_14]OGY48454.1 MAG: hypothetical protein A3D39_02475 [Candidatus Buchananbacteria bacterium RIFCSPHIGHO2_02_FULL_39_17]OGY55306.1 MAG: hypothetical protein A2912_02610 [Candidatus Buchananbacteria bacterium RIFCSPLOWO2_01_FULL_40_23b]
MYYVYILKSQKDGKLYIGYTNNLKVRLEKHNQGKSFSTKRRGPLIFKTGWGRNYIKRNLKNTLLI